ncbi:MAG: Wadjet anti-phage system protein JetD domain-containing protein [Bacteroidota bacterium]
MDYLCLILNALLDRYERSAHYRGERPVKRRVSFAVRPDTLPAYFDDSTARFKNEINQSAEMLEQRGIVYIRWVKHERGNLIDRVDLALDRVQAAYELAGRTPKSDHVARSTELIRTYRGRARSGGWLSEFFDHALERLSARESVARYFDMADQDEAEKIFRALVALQDLDEETPKRVFSARALGDSKAFERIEGRVRAILKDFHPMGGHSQEILAEIGLVDTFQYVYLSGQMETLFGGWPLDLGCFVPDVGLPTPMIEHLHITGLAADYVITIENLTSYHEFLRANPGHRDASGRRYLAIYLGGYHNRPRRELLRRIHRYTQDNCAPGATCDFHHWSDIDYGGFSIFVHLQKSLGIDLRPYRMDLDTLIRYERFAKPLARGYAGRLRRLLADPEFECFHPVIEYMLKKGIRLEQEALV